MNKISYVLIVLFIVVSIFGISAVAAGDVSADMTDITHVDGLSADTVELHAVESAKENAVAVESSEDADDADEIITISNVEKSSSKSKLTYGNSPSPFKVLDTYINTHKRNVINLDCDYKYNSNSDSDYVNGIEISNNLTINGNGHTLDGNRQSRIFKITKNGIKVFFNNINFINGCSKDLGGAAIYGNCTATNCTFRNGDLRYFGNGGAMYGGTAIGCVFENNNYMGSGYGDTKGGAMYGGSAINCTFKRNGAGIGGAVADCYVENCTFEENNAGNWAGAMSGGYAKGCTFIKNSAPMSGGAIDNGNAEDCTFIGNKAGTGSAMFEGSAAKCLFANNSAEWGGKAIQSSIVTLCTFDNDAFGDTTVNIPNFAINSAGTGLSAAKDVVVNLKDSNRTYDGVKVTLNIFKANELVATYHVLSGAVCSLDLGHGVYDLVLSIDDFPEIQSFKSTLSL